MCIHGYTHTQRNVMNFDEQKVSLPLLSVACAVPGSGQFSWAGHPDPRAWAFTEMPAVAPEQERATEWVCRLSKPLLSARWVWTAGKDLCLKMPARKVTEPTRPSELEVQPVPGNLQEAVLADCRPWASCQVFASSKAVGRGTVVKEGQGPTNFADRHCKLTWRRHGKV